MNLVEEDKCIELCRENNPVGKKQTTMIKKSVFISRLWLISFREKFEAILFECQ
jgi:hypothetical protein